MNDLDFAFEAKVIAGGIIIGCALIAAAISLRTKMADQSRDLSAKSCYTADRRRAT
jgi:hypothetical protein